MSREKVEIIYKLFIMFKISHLFFITLLILFSACQTGSYQKIPKAVMVDKVKGGWAGKMIGVQYGAVMEFKAVGKTYEDSIHWKPEMVEGALHQDDIYGQLNFMMTFEQYGLDVAADSLARNFADARFPLCHANLQCRKNYFDAIPVAELATPENNIHCEDIDFQIEADFIGFVNPAMPQSSNALCQKVGSLMAWGDGLYGGMFVAAMHTLAFTSNDVVYVVEEALKAIPAQSTYAMCIRDVLDAYRQDADNWRRAWQRVQEKWGQYNNCTPFHQFNIDAKINGAYIAIGLLFGKGDFEKTMEIAVRCGQDTDCNAANAAAVLGIIYGYEGIPEQFKSAIPAMADKEFLFTHYSFNKAVDQSMAFVEQNVLANGGKVTDTEFIVRNQQPVAPATPQHSMNLRMKYYVQVLNADKWRFDENWSDFTYSDGDNDPYKVANGPGATLEIDFEGSGVALLGSWNVDCGKAKVYIDGEFMKEIDTYYREEAGKYDVNRAYIFHKMNLPSGKHTLRLMVSDEKNPLSAGHKLYVERMIVY